MAIHRILIVDDHPLIRNSMANALRVKRYSVLTAQNIEESKKLLGRDKIDVIFLDVQLPDGDGISLLECLSAMPEKPIVIVMSGHGTIEMAVAAMRLGAFDFLVKPFDMEQAEKLIKKAAAFYEVQQFNRDLPKEEAKVMQLLGDCPAMTALKQLIYKVAPTDATVLISGENGTGKELVANEIFNLSSRREGPFIKINCAAVSETLMESEFFGHEKGSFTGATERREGRFELANGGTLLLDEISEIPPQLQAKLLRVLQEREFERVGGSKTIKVDVRILATTNRDMKKAVANGDFREDLYYRLNVFPLNIPPLRERKESIQMLAETFLDRFCKKYNRSIPGFSQNALAAMINHKWFGNVRELQNCVERAVILAMDDVLIEPEALGLRSVDLICTPTQATHPAPIAAPVSFPSINTISFENKNWDQEKIPSLEEMEETHIQHALSLTKGNRARAASLLKISIRTLRNKLNQYKNRDASTGVEQEEEEEEDEEEVATSESRRLA